MSGKNICSYSALFSVLVSFSSTALAAADVEVTRAACTVKYDNGDSMTIRCSPTAGCKVSLVVRGKKIAPTPAKTPENAPWYAGDFLLIRSTFDKDGFLLRYPVVCAEDQPDDVHARCFLERRFSGTHLEDEYRVTKYIYDNPQ